MKKLLLLSAIISINCYAINGHESTNYQIKQHSYSELINNAPQRQIEQYKIFDLSGEQADQREFRKNRLIGDNLNFLIYAKNGNVYEFRDQCSNKTFYDAKYRLNEVNFKNVAESKCDFYQVDQGESQKFIELDKQQKAELKEFREQKKGQYLFIDGTKKNDNEINLYNENQQIRDKKTSQLMSKKCNSKTYDSKKTNTLIDLFRMFTVTVKAMPTHESNFNHYTIDNTIFYHNLLESGRNVQVKFSAQTWTAYSGDYNFPDIDNQFQILSIATPLRDKPTPDNTEVIADYCYMLIG